jgi:hypothetical protein
LQAHLEREVLARLGKVLLAGPMLQPRRHTAAVVGVDRPQLVRRGLLLRAVAQAVQERRRPLRDRLSLTLVAAAAVVSLPAQQALVALAAAAQAAQIRLPVRMELPTRVVAAAVAVRVLQPLLLAAMAGLALSFCLSRQPITRACIPGCRP